MPFEWDEVESLKSVILKASVLYYLKLKRVDRLDVNSIRDPRVQAAALTGLLRMAQRETMEIKDAIKLIKRHGRVTGVSPLAKLLPRLDENGVLRMMTRLDLADRLDLDARCPVILLKDHPIVRLIILDIHERLFHSGGVQHTLAELQKKYWVPQALTYVRHLLSHCAVCQNLNAQQRHQRMAMLPLHRIPHPNDRVKPFNTCGIDCAGPFLTVMGRAKARAKRYMLIFTCTLYRAVHIEMLYSLDAPSLLKALTRFVLIRDRPSVIISDNGLNFVRGDSDLKELWKLIKDDPSLRKKYPEITWQFNTPAAPHTGGIFERLIRSAKKTFYAIAKQKDLTDEDLYTAFCIVQGTLNSRPLTTVSSDPKDLEPITPASFLNPWADGLQHDLAPVPEDYYYQARWHRLQRIMDNYWSRFCNEYTAKLMPFTKWTSARPNLKVGEKVIVLENKYRGFWPIGEVTQIFPSADGLIRSVEVKLDGKKYKRPVHNIIPLKLEAVGELHNVDDEPEEDN